jgi:hypothetical protein
MKKYFFLISLLSSCTQTTDLKHSPLQALEFCDGHYKNVAIDCTPRSNNVAAFVFTPSEIAFRCLIWIDQMRVDQRHGKCHQFSNGLIGLVAK